MSTMSEMAPTTPRSRGPGHRTNSPLRAPPRHPPISSRMNSRTVTPRRVADSPMARDSPRRTPDERRGSSPVMPVRGQINRGNPSAESINFELLDDNSIRFVSEDPTHRTVSPAPGAQHSMASSEIEFHIEPSAPPARDRSTATEKSDIQFYVEPSPYTKSMSPEPQPLASAGTGRSTPVPGAGPPLIPRVPTTASTKDAVVMDAEDEESPRTATVSPATPPPAALSPSPSEDVSVAPTPAHVNPNDTQPPASRLMSDTPSPSEGAKGPATPAAASAHEEVPEAEQTPAPAAADASTSDVFGDIAFNEAGANENASQRYIDITEDEDDNEDAEAPAANASAGAKEETAVSANKQAAQQRRRSSFMPTVWDRPWEDPPLQGATNKPPPMAPAPYETRKHGEHQPWDPKPSAAVRAGGATAMAGDNKKDTTEQAYTPRPRDPKPWLANSVLDPTRRRRTSASARSPRKSVATATGAAADGETPTVTPRRASQQISPRQDTTAVVSPRIVDSTSDDDDDDAAEEYRRLSMRPSAARAAPEAAAAANATSGPLVIPEVPVPAPSAVMNTEVVEWNQLVTQQDTLQFLSAQERERERLVVQVAHSLDTLTSVDTRVMREVYAARDAVIRRTGADVNGDALKPVRQGRSRSATPSRRRQRTPSREAFVDRLYPFDSVAAQAPDYLAQKRQQQQGETRHASVLSDDEVDEVERAENEEDMEDWRDERALLRDEKAVLKQQNAELQFHMRRGTNIKGLTDIQPVTPRTPLARNMRKQSTAVDFFGYDRLAELRIKAKEEELALEKAKRAHEDVAAKAKDWPTRLRSREATTSAEHEEAKTHYMEALSTLDETLARARVLRVNLGTARSAEPPTDVHGTVVPALTFGTTPGSEDSETSAGAAAEAGASSRSPRPTTGATPRGSAVPMSARRQDSKQLLGAKLQQAQALVVAAKTREEQVTTPRTGRRGRSGSRSARRRSPSPAVDTANEYTGEREGRQQSIHERLSTHKTLSAMNRESPAQSPERSARR